ncbi:hypothetical protein BHM03_00031095 [Ensete ventricosum]|nr:hypothetical protein BHM03_00031095 [Ensete ventricosum]
MFARGFVEGIGKLIENTPGDYRKKTRRLTVRMPEAVGLAGVDVVRNSLRVRREVTKGIGSLLGCRKRVRQKKTKTRRKIVKGSRKACWERFTEGIGKLTGNTPGDCQKKTEDSPQECRRLPDLWELGLGLACWSLSVVIIES